jgi:hypothetical protein
MSKPPPISQDDLRRLLGLRPVYLRLLRIAYNRARSAALAKDLVADTVTILLRGVSPWRPDPGRPVDDQLDALIVHASLIIRRVHYNRVTSLPYRSETEFPEDLAGRTGDGQSNIEEAAVELEGDQQQERRATVWVEALRARMKGDKEALAVIGQHQLGVDDVDEQASALRLKRAEVILARRRIAYHAPIVRAEQLEAERKAEEETIAAAKAAEKDRVQP